MPMPATHLGLGISAVAAAGPVLLYLIAIWRLDRYRREPLWLVGLTFLWGAAGAMLLSYLVTKGVIDAAKVKDARLSSGLIAPLSEEAAKAMVLLLLLLTPRFDNTTDGLIYGAAAGLGFAMTENFLYFINADQAGGAATWRKVVIVRSLASALLHCTATAAAGAIIGRFRYRGAVKQWLLAPLLGLAVAASMHGAFNSALVASQRTHDKGYSLMAFAIIPIAAIALFAITMISLHREHRMLAFELREEAAMGLLPPAHADILPFYRKRQRRDWLDPRIDKKQYVECATLLAFRKWQSKLPAGSRPEIAADIKELRQKIAALLAPR
jgi:RsiW-degrading membrane proteinase PrsW (M82 family)